MSNTIQGHGIVVETHDTGGRFSSHYTIARCECGKKLCDGPAKATANYPQFQSEFGAHLRKVLDMPPTPSLAAQLSDIQERLSGLEGYIGRLDQEAQESAAASEPHSRYDVPNILEQLATANQLYDRCHEDLVTRTRELHASNQERDAARALLKATREDASREREETRRRASWLESEHEAVLRKLAEIQERRNTFGARIGRALDYITTGGTAMYKVTEILRGEDETDD